VPVSTGNLLPNQRWKSIQNHVQETLDIAAQFFVYSVRPVHTFGLVDEQFAHPPLSFSDLLKESIVAPGRSFLRGRKPRQAGDNEVDISLSLFRCHVASDQEGRRATQYNAMASPMKGLRNFRNKKRGQTANYTALTQFNSVLIA
jgi:hypothetical protein